MSNNEYISGEENKGIIEQSINSEKYIYFIISIPQEKIKISVRYYLNQRFLLKLFILKKQKN